MKKERVTTMKKPLYFLLALCLVFTAPLKVIGDENSLSQTAIDSEAIWRPGSGASDGSYTAVSLSMLGWGIGLAITIAVLAAVLSEAN